MIPLTFTILNQTIYTFGIFLLTGLLLVVFVVWQEGRKDGFDEEKLFDLIILTIISSIFFSRLFFAILTGFKLKDIFPHVYKFWSGGLDIYGGILGALLVLYIVPRFWKWSRFRILDIFSLAFSLGFSVIVLGLVAVNKHVNFLFAFSSWIFLYVFLSYFRNSKLKSGIVYSIFMVSNAFLVVAFFKDRFVVLYLALILLGLDNLYRRRKKMGLKTNFISGFVLKVKKAFLKKDVE